MWPFRRKAAPAAETPPTSWRPGDLAKCMVSSAGWTSRIGPDHDDILRVISTRYALGTDQRTLCWGLEFGEFPGQFWDASCFRKIIVHHQAADAEWTAKTFKKRREPVE